MKIRGSYLWLSLPALLLAAGSVLAGPRLITECGAVITRPGNYKLLNDLSCPPNTQGINIEASNVTLDLRGHTIACDAFGDAKVGAVIIGSETDPQIKNVRVSHGAVTGCDDGILLWGTQNVKVQNMSFHSNVESAVTLLAAEDTIVMHNEFVGDYWSIRSYWGSGNRFNHNSIIYSVVGMDFYAETGSQVTCNDVEKTAYSISFGPLEQDASMGNVVRGNRVNDNYLGIALFGYGTPDELMGPQSSDNLVRGNIATGNDFADLAEVIYDDFYEIFIQPGAVCQNYWERNQFGTQLGPQECISEPVVLNDVCAPHADDE